MPTDPCATAALRAASTEAHLDRFGLRYVAAIDAMSITRRGRLVVKLAPLVGRLLSRRRG